MSTPAATASGDRSVAVGGDVVGSVIVTGDNVNINVGAGEIGGTLLDLLGRQRVEKRARPRPLDVRPAPFDDRLDREEEVAALVTGDAGRLSVVGEALVGKTYVVRAALAEAAAHPSADGIVCLRGRGQTFEDLVQALWEELYETSPPTKPSARELRKDLAEREALIVVDDAELEHGDAQALADFLPRSRLILVSRERRLWDGTELSIAGLPPDASLAMLERDLGRPLTAGEGEAAAALSLAVGGHPQRLRQAAGIVARGAQTLGQLAASSSGRDLALTAVANSTERERDVVAALEPFGDAPVAAGQVEALAGPGGEKTAEALVRLGILVHGSSYSLAVDPGDVLDVDRLEAARSRAVDHFARLAEEHPEQLGDDLPAALALLRRVASLGRWQDVLRLGRALAPALVLARRFGAWAQAADLVHAAAQRLDDVGARAWALHELGTRALCDEDRSGMGLLKEALELREGIGDERGAATTRHNLRLPAGPPWYLRRIVHLPVIALLISLAVIVSAGGAALVALGGGDDGGGLGNTVVETGGPEPEQNTLDIDLIGDGTVKAGSAAACDQSCERDFDHDQQVDLDATPASGWRFAGWSGDCSGNDCTVSLDQNRNVTARFVETAGDGHVLTVEFAEGGTITSEPPGIACGADCTERFTASPVTLSAAADDGWRLSDWGRAGCDPAGDCAVDLSADVSVRPSFVRLAALEIVVAEGGTVSFADDDGTTLVCPEDCSAVYPSGTTVELSATPNEGYADPDWQREGCLPGPDCGVRLDADTTVTPVFGRMASLELTLRGKGTGAVSSENPPFKCGERRCMEPVVVGRTVQLVAVPANDSELESWEGDAKNCAGTLECSIVIDDSPAVTATFMPKPQLSVTVNGPVGSRVVSSPAGIDCEQSDAAKRTTCTAFFARGTTVSLTPVPPSEEVYLAAWGGECSGNKDCRVPLTGYGRSSVTAGFDFVEG